ncbi:MAG: hypothetical protein NTY23_00220 [Chloroflexi bacterium]|nr:hypothetical protein [Chloroflexota bacterium]
MDNDSAFLVVPFGDQEERFLVRFDSTGSKILYWAVMRYKNGEGKKILWINGTWMDDGRPWADFRTEDILFNVDVDVSLPAKGP